MSQNKPRIQTYVADKWLVSTAWRPFDTYEGESWGYETRVWRWDAATKEIGALIAQGVGINDHFDFCRRLMKGCEEDLSDDSD